MCRIEKEHKTSVDFYSRIYDNKRLPATIQNVSDNGSLFGAAQRVPIQTMGNETDCDSGT